MDLDSIESTRDCQVCMASISWWLYLAVLYDSPSRNRWCTLGLANRDVLPLDLSQRCWFSFNGRCRFRVMHSLVTSLQYLVTFLYLTGFLQVSFDAASMSIVCIFVSGRLWAYMQRHICGRGFHCDGVL